MFEKILKKSHGYEEHTKRNKMLFVLAVMGGIIMIISFGIAISV